MATTPVYRIIILSVLYVFQYDMCSKLQQLNNCYCVDSKRSPSTYLQWFYYYTFYQLDTGGDTQKAQPVQGAYPYTIRKPLRTAYHPTSLYKL